MLKAFAYIKRKITISQRFFATVIVRVSNERRSIFRISIRINISWRYPSRSIFAKVSQIYTWIYTKDALLGRIPVRQTPRASERDRCRNKAKWKFVSRTELYLKVSSENPMFWPAFSRLRRFSRFFDYAKIQIRLVHKLSFFSLIHSALSFINAARFDRKPRFQFLCYLPRVIVNVNQCH